MPPAPPPSSDLAELNRRLAALEAWKRELGADGSRLREENKQALDEMVAGARTIFERMMREALRSLAPQLDDIVKIAPQLLSLLDLNKEQMELLREARDERIRRRLREEELEAAARAAEIAAKRAEAALSLSSIDLDAKKFATDTRLRRWGVVASILVPIIAALAGLLGAALGSHPH